MTIEEVYAEAIQTFPATKVERDGMTEVFYKGIKIVSDDEGVRFFDTTKGGGTYAEFDLSEYAIMRNYGWREGLIRVKLLNYRRRLELIEARIRVSLVEKHSTSHIDTLKSRRETLTKAYAEASRQLNLICHGDNN